MDVKVLDGGFSSQIGVYVGDKVEGDPLWTARLLLTDPEAVKNTHLDFLEAGCDIIETNTYQATVDGFKRHLNLLEAEGKEVIVRAVKLAQEAVATYKLKRPDANIQIFGSVGPYGAALHDGSEYTGSYADFTSDEELRRWHKSRIEALLEGGITHLALETIPCEKEALVLANLLHYYPTTKAWISFSCKDSKYLSHGEEFSKVAKKVYLSNPDQILAVGVNCLNPKYVGNLLEAVNQDSSNSIPFVVYANSGEKYINRKWMFQEQVPHLSDFIEDWIKLGVKYIGGCCRTKAEDIKLIKARVQELSKTH